MWPARAVGRDLAFLGWAGNSGFLAVKSTLGIDLSGARGVSDVFGTMGRGSVSGGCFGDGANFRGFCFEGVRNRVIVHGGGCLLLYCLFGVDGV